MCGNKCPSPTIAPAHAGAKKLVVEEMDKESVKLMALKSTN
jgi:hypothetical protein